MEEEYSRGPGGRPQHFHERSHGESFLALVQNNFRSNGLYLLDEPEAALSPQRQLTLLMEIDRCVKEGSQFIIVTHSPILLGFPGAQILSFDDGPIHPCTYEETDTYALMIADKEPSCDREIIALAALLHDADDHKLFATSNNANTRSFLEENHLPSERIDRICDVINSVSFSKNKGHRPETIEAKVVQDADRLDAIGAIGIARIFAYGGEHGRSLEESVQHFHDKLLLLKGLMNTETGKELAGKRHGFLEDFLQEFKEETMSDEQETDETNSGK